MYLTDVEKAMLNGEQGQAKAVAMDLLVRYAEALGAERMVKTNSCAFGVIGGQHPMVKALHMDPYDFDAMYSVFSLDLDTDKTIKIPQLTVQSACTLSGCSDDYLDYIGASADLRKSQYEGEEYMRKTGFMLTQTCAPYLCGVMPVKGEHCAWCESSAIIYLNSVIGARTNNEGLAATGSAAIAGRIPYFGLHLDEERRGTHLIQVERQPRTPFEWSLLGYYAGTAVQIGIPVINGINETPTTDMLKAIGAAFATAGAIDMFHVVGYTPEALNLEHAFGGNKPVDVIKFGEKELQWAIDKLNFKEDADVEMVMLGCPNYSISEIRYLAKVLENKKVKIPLLVMTANSTKAMSDFSGYTKTIEAAGGRFIRGGCPLTSGAPTNIKVLAVDSTKLAHYTPGLTMQHMRLGTVEQCVNAAVTGKWEEEKR